MSTARTVSFVLAGGFLFLATSLGRAERSGDCSKLAEPLAKNLRAMDDELANYDATKDDTNQRGLREVAASLEQLTAEIEGVHDSSNEIKTARAEVLATLLEMHDAVAAMRISTNVAAAKKASSDFLGARDKLGDTLAQLERACTD